MKKSIEIKSEKLKDKIQLREEIEQNRKNQDELMFDKK